MKKSWLKRGLALVLAAVLCAPSATNVSAATVTQTSQEETVYVSAQADDSREISFNEDWKFYLGTSSSAYQKSYDDSSWRSLTLPHDWSIEQSFTTSGEAESGFLPGGTGWYRKTFVLPESYAGKKISIDFGGVYMNCTVYVNGTALGTHPYGYTPFSFDLSDYVTCDGVTKNVVAVKVINQIPSSRWYSGSGIYRSVNLTVTDPVHVARYGITVTTPNLASQKNGNVDVSIQNKIENESASQQQVTVTSTVLDAQGQAVSQPVSTVQTVAAGAQAEVSQTAVVSKPALWSTDSPTLYQIRTEITAGGQTLDTVTTDFGFRYFSFNRNTGFSLNGVNTKLQGVCMHHDQGALGSAAYARAIERQMEKLKEMGCNAVRVTHNPASDELLDACNRLGLLVIEEAFDTWTYSKNGNSYDYARYFDTQIGSGNSIAGGSSSMTWAEFDVKAMVERGKNAPSIIMWSIGNEVLEGTSNSAPSEYPGIASDLVGWIQEVDTTRPVTFGDNKLKDNNSVANSIANVLTNAGGVVGANYSFASSNQYYNIWNRSSNWLLYGSETASACRSRGIYTTTGQDSTNLQITSYDSWSVGWGQLASVSWKDVVTRDYVAGEFVWTGFDYIGEPTPWNGTGAGSVSGNGAAPKSSYFGILDTAGFEKDIYYFYQSQWNDDVTTLHILPCWNRDSITVSSGKVNVVVYSNAASVELFLNGSSLGRKYFTTNTTSAGHTYRTCDGSLSMSWSVSYAEGTLSAKAYDASGNVISDTCGRSSVTTTGSASKLALSADRTTIQADGSDLSYITVDVTDANGNIVPNAANSLSFSLTGNGEIVGVDNGNAASTEKYVPASTTSATRKAFSGKALVIVKSTKEAGSFTLTASGSGLTSGSVTVATQAVDSGSQEGIASYRISRNYYVKAGITPALPASTAVTYRDGTAGTLGIEWDSYDASLLNAPGTFDVSGTLTGTDVKVLVTVHVIGNAAAMLNWSAITQTGTLPELPETLPIVLEDGTVSESFPVQWNAVAESDVASEGTFTVSGTAQVVGDVLPVTASIRVVKAVSGTVENIAANSYSDAPALSESASPTSDNLNSINDGVTSNADDTNARWTNYNVRNNNTPVYIELRWSQEYPIDRVDMYLFTDSYSASLPKTVSFQYWDGSSYRDVGSYSTTPVSFTSGVTSYGFNEEFTTSRLRVSFLNETGHCCGLTEMEVYPKLETVETYSTSSLSGITVNGTGVSGFDPDVREYTVSIPTGSTPAVQAQGADNAAVTILPVYENATRILVRAEDGSGITTYTVSYHEAGSVDKAVLAQLIADAESVISNSSDSYTESSVAALTTALAAARTVYNDTGATQQEVSDAETSLRNALAQLEEKSVDKSTLSLLVVNAESVVNDSNTYTDRSVAVLADVLAAAKTVYNDTAATQQQVSDAETSLREAFAQLRKKTAPTVSFRMTSNGTRLVMTGQTDPEFGDYYEIIEHGVVFIRTSNLRGRTLNVNTSGRTKVKFGDYSADGSWTYNYKPSSGTVSYTARAYIRYRDANGSTFYEYSDPVSLSVR